jgi:hypothetical protein
LTAEQLAEQALVGLRVDRDDHRAAAGLAVEIDDQAKQVEVQRAEDQLEHLAGLRLGLGRRRGQRRGRGKHPQRPAVESGVQGACGNVTLA